MPAKQGTRRSIVTGHEEAATASVPPVASGDLGQQFMAGAARWTLGIGMPGTQPTTAAGGWQDGSGHTSTYVLSG